MKKPKEEIKFCKCGARLFDKTLNSYRYGECENCFWKDGSWTPASNNRKFVK